MDVFVALADPVRRRLLEALVEYPRPVKELVELFPISQPAISRHLRVLREAGIVEAYQLGDDARVRLYRLQPEPFAEVQQWLALLWQQKLDAFAAHAREHSAS
jgi:DNA-binding transcriptional ArsR family regulator